MFEFNPTVLAQIVDFLILIGILFLIFNFLFKQLFKRSVLIKVERIEADVKSMEDDIKEIKEILQQYKKQ
jgi:large-conductance mechanosensitive channel